MKNRKNKEKVQCAYFYMLIGIVLIITISLMQGSNAFFEAMNHIINDLTNELLVHLYIAGFILLIVGVYVFVKERK